MAFEYFTPTVENFEVLRTRLNEFIKKEYAWGAGKLLEEVDEHRPINKDPQKYRAAINKFRRGEQDTIDIEVARSLWSYLLADHENATLNKRGLALDVKQHRVSHELRHFFQVDEQKAARDYAPSLAGHYMMVRQHWNHDDHIAVGRLQFTPVAGTDNHVIAVEEWVRDKPTSPEDTEQHLLEYSEGYAFPKGVNIFAFMRTDKSSQPKIVTIENVIPEPQRKEPFRVLRGSIYAGIGQGPHWAKRFVAHRISAKRKFEICTKKLDSDIIDEFGHHIEFWLKGGL